MHKLRLIILLDALNSKPAIVLRLLDIFPFSNIANAIYKFSHENGSIKSVLYWDVSDFCFSDSLTHEMATTVNGRNIYVN